MRSPLLPLLALLVAIGIFFAYVSPVWNGKVAAARAAIAQDVVALDAAARYTERENQLAAERNAIDPAALAKLDAFVPDSVNNVRLILDLNALANRSGLALTSIDVASGQQNGASAPASAMPAPPNPVGSIDMDIAASGTYSAFQAFLEGIEMSQRLLDVRDITIKSSDTGVYTYKLTVRIYWLR